MQPDREANQAAFDPNFWHSYFYQKPSFEVLVSLKEKVLASEEVATRYYYPDKAGWSAREHVDHDIQMLDHERMTRIWRDAYEYALRTRQMSQNQFRAWQANNGIKVPTSYYDKEVMSAAQEGLDRTFVETDDKPREQSTDEERKLKAYKEDLERTASAGRGRSAPENKPTPDRYDTRASGERSFLGSEGATVAGKTSPSRLR